MPELRKLVPAYIYISPRNISTYEYPSGEQGAGFDSEIFATYAVRQYQRRKI
jgi:hypothetical protein